MQDTQSHLAMPDRPFPHARKSSALEEEDQFLEAHGGRGARFVFLAVCLIEAICAGLVGCLRGIITLRLVRDLIAEVGGRLQRSDQQKAALHDPSRRSKPVFSGHFPKRKQRSRA